MRLQSWPKWLNSRWVLVILIIVLLCLIALELNQWRKRRQIQQEIDQIVKQQQELEQKNSDLATSLNLLNTKDYKERIAREQLNLKKEGEIVVNFSQAENRAGTPALSAESNAHKWWRYFFSK